MRRWFGLLAALYPPSWSAAQRRELAVLLADAGRPAGRRGPGASLAYALHNTAVCLRDAGAEWAAFVLSATTGGGGMGGWIQDVRWGVRGLLRRPGYAVPALLTLALGIGINAAMFSVLRSVVLNPLPYPDSDRIVAVAPAEPGEGARFSQLSLPDVEDWSAASTTLAHLAGYTTLPSDLIHVADGTAREAPTAYVTSGFFQVLGSAPAHGRFFTEADADGDPLLAVVSERFFRRSLGGDPARIGGTLELTGRSYRLLGVAPAEVAFPAADVDVWVPVTSIPATSIPFHFRGVRLLPSVGRLATGRTVDDAREELGAIAAELARIHPDSNGDLTAARVRPLHEVVVGPVRRSLGILMAAAALVLAILCVNLANLALTREARRQGDSAVRAALGASGGRRMRLVFVEALLLGVAGGAVGVVLARAGVAVLVASAGDLLPRMHEVQVRWPVVAVGLALGLASALAFAVLPALSAARSDLASRLRAGRGSAAGPGRLLLAGQAAVSLVLLVGALLMIRTVANLSRQDPGFAPDGLVAAEITFPETWYPERADFVAQYWTTLDALAAIPGVRDVSAVRRFPFHGSGEDAAWTSPAVTEGEEPEARLLQVAPGYFATMGIALEGGDVPRSGDFSRLIPVVVSRSLAARAFPGEEAVGRNFEVDGFNVVVRGVAGDVRQTRLTAAPPDLVYFPQEANPRRGTWFVLRTDGAPGVVAAVRETVRRLDPAQPISRLAPVPELFRDEIARPMLVTRLLGGFAVVAVVLSAIGVYGVVAYGVARRRREMGIRLALGEGAARVRRRVVRDGLVPIVGGIVLGIGAAALGARALEGLVFGVSVGAPVPYAVAALTLVAAGALACWIPATAAARIDPVEALAGE